MNFDYQLPEDTHENRQREMVYPTRILNHLGGGNFIVMTDATNMAFTKNTFEFFVPKNISEANKIVITYDEKIDRYLMDFVKHDKLKSEVIKQEINLKGSELRDKLETNTQLSTH